MKPTFFTSILIITLLLVSVGCGKNPSGSDDRPVFSYAEPIVNPPDDFLVVFNTSIAGDRFASISFATHSVWEIEKLGDGRISLFMSNDSINYPILTADTLGLKADKNYKIIVSNIYTSELNNFFVGFKKLDIDYENFEPKL